MGSYVLRPCSYGAILSRLLLPFTAAVLDLRFCLGIRLTGSPFCYEPSLAINESHAPKGDILSRLERILDVYHSAEMEVDLTGIDYFCLMPRPTYSPPILL